MYPYGGSRFTLSRKLIVQHLQENNKNRQKSGVIAPKMNLPSRVFVFHHGRQIASLEVCDLKSVKCDVSLFAKSLPVAVRVDKSA